MGEPYLLYIDEHSKFDVNKINTEISKFKNIKNISKQRVYALAYEYSYEEDFVYIFLSKQEDIIRLENAGDAAIAAALEIQRICGRPLRIIDQGYSFDLDLSLYSTPEELKRAIAEEEARTELDD